MIKHYAIYIERGICSPLLDVSSQIWGGFWLDRLLSDITMLAWLLVIWHYACLPVIDSDFGDVFAESPLILILAMSLLSLHLCGFGLSQPSQPEALWASSQTAAWERLWVFVVKGERKDRIWRMSFASEEKQPSLVGSLCILQLSNNFDYRVTSVKILIGSYRNARLKRLSRIWGDRLRNQRYLENVRACVWDFLPL